MKTNTPQQQSTMADPSSLAADSSGRQSSHAATLEATANGISSAHAGHAGAPSNMESLQLFPQNTSGGGRHAFAPPPPNSAPRYYSSPEPPATSGLVQNSSMFAVGSVVGLTAVAALRWLNGDDFYLWPSASDLHVRQQDQGRQRPSYADNTDNQLQLVQQLQVMQASLEAQREQQALILQRLQDRDSRAITDGSMNLLRQRSTTTVPPIPSDYSEAAKLQEILQELVQLRYDLAGMECRGRDMPGDWDERLLETTEQLQRYLQKGDALDATASLSESSSPAFLGQKATGESAAELGVDTAETTVAREGPEATPTMDSREAIGATPVDTFSTTFSSKAQKLTNAVRLLATENGAATLQAGVPLLYLYVVNLSSHPRVPRYRKIFTCNESFQKVAKLIGARELLTAVGFVETKNALEWLANDNGKDNTGVQGDYIILLRNAAAALDVLKKPAGDIELASAALSAMEVFPESVGDNDDADPDLVNPSDMSTTMSDSTRDKEPCSPPRHDAFHEELPPSPPALVNDAFTTPKIGTIASPPPIKHSHSPSSFRFDYETPVKGNPVLDRFCIDEQNKSMVNPLGDDADADQHTVPVWKRRFDEQCDTVYLGDVIIDPSINDDKTNTNA